MSAVVSNLVPSRDSTLSAAPNSNCLPRMVELFTNTFSRAFKNPTISLLTCKTLLFLGTSPDVIVNADERISALHWAAAKGNIGVARALLDAGANSDAQDCDQWTPLHYAATRGDVDMTKVLLKDRKYRASKSRDLRTPGFIARIESPHNYELHKLLPLTDEENRLFSSSYISNTFNWRELYSSPEHGADIELEGGCAESFNPYLAESLRAFKEEEFFSNLNISREKFDTLLNAFDETNSNRSNEEILETIQRGDLCFINGGWDDHAITLCFMKRGEKTYMAICNRGQRKTARSTLEVFEIDPKMLTVEQIEKIKPDNSPFEEREVFYYSELPSLLHASKVPTQDELCMHIQKFAPGTQKSGKCAIASSTAAIRFAWMMLLYDSTEVDMTLQQGQRESKFFTDFAAIDAWEKYKEEMLPGLIENPSLIDAIYGKLIFLNNRATIRNLCISPKDYQVAKCISERVSQAFSDLS